ncbi:response regulator receiver domain-containing protein (CheY-like) [Marinobacter santoriniensis NKSG1]|uniref:Response regulator receiver domain-containing protein (CheY-like) n=1 Tax=Marinobacter santoriniensis NKSG1 TaxID=1288826 RepID=M7D652_9GAMM|nr:PEP-CTERM sorting domain-containing protein [Marinobacter santoriniensis]EMP56208.1 response regulator receiver domain-containing protein (CheY-like) [Marinobacter santoriniensis NKSG1]
MSLITRIAALGALGFSLAVATPASANLIVNGGFESPEVAAGSWQYFSSADVDGWNGDNIEIWNDLNGVTAYEGDQFAELNAHPYSGSTFGIYQSFATTADQTYNLSFAYRARQSNDESFNVSVTSPNVIGGPLESWLMDDHVVGEWKVFSTTFVALSELTTLTFSTTNASTIGNFLDAVDVSVPVPEPGTLGLLGLGVLGLGMARRRQSA